MKSVFGALALTVAALGFAAPASAQYCDPRWCPPPKPTPVPEPGDFGLFALAAAGLIVARRAAAKRKTDA